ncbi:hypothetical protein TNCV_744591 [Trichonephila clavipes]|nr:hypothetical protein TNCV_744591 [Trichonephila clavipes]
MLMKIRNLFGTPDSTAKCVEVKSNVLEPVCGEHQFQSDAYEAGFQYLTDKEIFTNCVVKFVCDDGTNAEDGLNEEETNSYSPALKSSETL